MDVPPPGQGKRSQRKAWRDNSDQAIAIYSLAAEETTETTTTVDVTSEALPFWDDAPQQQPQTHLHSQPQHQIYTEEEAQELVEKAYHEGWQQGMEEGYRLWKDKGYKVQELVNRVNTTTQTDPTAPFTTRYTRMSSKTTPNIKFGIPIEEITNQAVPDGATCSKPIAATFQQPQLASTTPSDYVFSPSSSIEPPQPTPPLFSTDSSNSTPTSSISIATALWHPKSFPAAFGSPTSSNAPIHDTWKTKIIEIDEPGPSSRSTCSKPTPSLRLDAESTTNDILDTCVIHADLQIAVDSSQNVQKNFQLSSTPTSTSTNPTMQKAGSTSQLVDVDTQEHPPAFEMGSDSEKNPLATTCNLNSSPRTPLLPSFQPLLPAPYKRTDIPSEAPHTLTASQNDPKSPENSTTAHSFSQTTQAANPTSPIISGNPSALLLHVPTPEHSPMSPLASTSITIHAQTVIINNHPAASSAISKNGSTVFKDSDSDEVPLKYNTRNSEDKPQAPASPATTAIPPRDLSILRSCPHPFSSLRRRSRRRQSTPAQGLNWGSHLHRKDLSQTLQALGWSPAIY